MECTLENILPHVYGLDEKRLAARLSLYLAVSDGAQIAYSGGHGASVGLQQNVSLRAVDGGGARIGKRLRCMSNSNRNWSRPGATRLSRYR